MKIKAPEGWKNFAMGGQEHTLEPDGTIELPDSTAKQLIDLHGFTAAPIARADAEPSTDHDE